MQKNKISHRLKTLMEQAVLIKTDLESVADIGTDHGYLPFAMLENQLMKTSILCDINRGPLDNAIQTFADSSHVNQVDFRLGSGIEALAPGEVDLVFIAGMGGGLIQEILSKDLDKSKSFPYFILQPMTEQTVLRAWLLENGFEILWDHFVQDGRKHYEIIVMSPNKISRTGAYDILMLPKWFENNNGCDLEFGKQILKNQTHDYINFLAYKDQKYQIILNRITKESLTDSNEKLDLCRSKLETIQNIRKILG